MNKKCKYCKTEFICNVKFQKFCSIKCRDKYSYYFRGVRDKRIEKRKTNLKLINCFLCNKTFKMKRNNQKFCSIKCTTKYSNMKKFYILFKHNCKICNKMFYNTRKNILYCNKKCKNKSHYFKNREKRLEQKKIYHQRPEVKARIKDYDRFKRPNKELRAKKKIEWDKKMYHNDLFFKLKYVLRRRLNIFLKIKNLDRNNNTTIDLLGCEPKFLKKYLESKFTFGMNWKNYGYGWHMDHIIPLNSASCEEDVKRLFHYTNLQPLWASENLKKGCKLL